MKWISYPMQKLFNNILVPCHLDRDPELSIEKAIQIANHFRCNLHLIYVENTWFTPPERKVKVDRAREIYSPRLQAGLELHISIRRGNTDRIIREYAIQQCIDLLVLGRARRRNIFLDVNRFSALTECPVLTIRDTPDLEKVKNIVLP